MSCKGVKRHAGTSKLAATDAANMPEGTLPRSESLVMIVPDLLHDTISLDMVIYHD